MKRLIVIAIVCGMLAGCGVKKAYLKDSFDYKETGIGDIKIDSVTIIDERKNTGAREFDIPSFSWKGVEDNLSPILTEEQKGVIKDEVRKHSNESGKLYGMTVLIQKGTIALKAKRLNAVETAEFSVKLSLSDGIDIRESSGEALLEISSLKASNDYLEQLYRKAIREAIHKAIMGLKK